MSAADYKDKGNAEFQRGNFMKAVELYTYATELDPNNHIYFGNRSNAHFCLNNFDKSLRDAQKAVALCPAWAKGHYRAGLALRALQRWAESLSAMQQAARLEPAAYNSAVAEAQSLMQGRHAPPQPVQQPASSHNTQQQVPYHSQHQQQQQQPPYSQHSGHGYGMAHPPFRGRGGHDRGGGGYARGGRGGAGRGGRGDSGPWRGRGRGRGRGGRGGHGGRGPAEPLEFFGYVKGSFLHNPWMDLLSPEERAAEEARTLQQAKDRSAQQLAEQQSRQQHHAQGPLQVPDFANMSGQDFDDDERAKKPLEFVGAEAEQEPTSFHRPSLSLPAPRTGAAAASRPASFVPTTADIALNEDDEEELESFRAKQQSLKVGKAAQDRAADEDGVYSDEEKREEETEGGHKSSQQEAGSVSESHKGKPTGATGLEEFAMAGKKRQHSPEASSSMSSAAKATDTHAAEKIEYDEFGDPIDTCKAKKKKKKKKRKKEQRDEDVLQKEDVLEAKPAPLPRTINPAP
eukprot:g16777.t1